jgi:drug/metabolite transporter (DMT)-like permease
MALSPQKQGVLFLSGESLLWSLFPIVTAVTVQTVPPVWAAGLATLVAAVFFAVTLTLQGRWKEIHADAWGYLVLAVLFIGVGYMGLLFIGLRYTSAGNVSLLALMEIFFAFLILSVILRWEPIRPRNVIGAVLMCAGAAVILDPRGLSFNIGDLLILIAVMLPPLGNHYQKLARRHVSSSFILFFRSLGSAVVLIVLGLAFEPLPSLEGFQASLPLILVNGLLLLGLSKIFWIEALHRLDVTQAVLIVPVRPALTLLFAWMLLGDAPTTPQLVALVPLAMGVVLVTRR